MKMVGVIFIILSTGSVGLRIAYTLRKRCLLLRQLVTSLQVMRNEIGCCGTPLPQTFALMAISSDGAVSRVFSAVAKEMDKRRWITPRIAMEEALKAEPTLGEDRDVAELLLSLASGIGRYDRESQLQALDKSKGDLDALLRAADRECSVRSKTYEVLGICAGISVAILLI